jgi:hypothetical protein
VDMVIKDLRLRIDNFGHHGGGGDELRVGSVGC